MMPKQETCKAKDEISKVSEELTEQGVKKVRMWLIKELMRTMDYASNKVHNYCRPKSDKIKWARLQGYTAQTLASILKDAEIEEIKQKLEVLENAINKEKN